MQKEALINLQKLWIEAGLSQTPRLDHAVRGIGVFCDDMLGDHVELIHQISGKFEQ